VKRLVLAGGLLVVALVAAYGYGITRRDARYRELLLVGDAATARRDFVAAIEAFSGAIALRPDSMVAHLKRGEAYRRRDELETALRDLRRAVELDPSAPRPRELLGDVSFAMGRYARAAERYREYIALDDSSHRLFYKLALAQYRAGRPSACVTALESGLDLQPRLAEAHYLMGLCLQQAGRRREALAALERSVSLAPTTSQAREELADLYGLLGRADKRIGELEALRALDAGPAREVALGLAYAESGDTASAIQVLGRAARRYPTYRYTYAALGRVWLDAAEATGDPIALGKALEALGNATGAEDNAEALALAGRAYLLASDVESAERMLLQATEKLPVDPAAFGWLAEAAERLGHYEVARAALLDYDALLPDPSARERDARFARRVADLSMRLDDAVTALIWYRRAVSADPADAGLLVSLADAEWRAGDPGRARTAVDKALALDPRHAAGLALKRKLER
jgi:tetratricopeptide (TPR) repeat protein